MFSLLKKMINKKTRKRIQIDGSTNKGGNPGHPLLKNFERNHAYLKSLFKDCDDIHFRKIKIANTDLSALVVYVDGLANKDQINADVIRMLTI